MTVAGAVYFEGLDTSGLGGQVNTVFSGFGAIIVLLGAIGLAIAIAPRVIAWFKRSAK